MDPYVVVDINKKQFKTKVHENAGKNPVWNHSLSINVDNYYNSIKFTVLDEDLLKSDIIGSNTLPIDQFIVK